MAIVLVITRPDKTDDIKEIPVNRKLVLGHSVYCDVVLDDKSVANMQCEIEQAKTGHILAKNLDLKKEVHINQSRLKRSALKTDDVLKIGPFILRIDPTKLTPEEVQLLNSEFEELV